MRSFVLAFLAFVLCSEVLASETIYAKRKANPVREGAGSYYNLVGSVPENTPLIVIARSGSWVKVQLPNKQVGWVAANSLRAEKSSDMVARSPEAMWSSPKALSAAIKGFAAKYVDGPPGVIDTVMQYSEKGFTSEDLDGFAREVRQSRSLNRSRMSVEDLKLQIPEYSADLPEQQIGTGIAARIAGKGIVNNRPLHRYVNMICATVAGNSPLYDADLTVLVLNDRMANAFAVPGGYVFVTLGLVRLCADESELAGVIAHEIAHVYRRHGLQELSRRTTQIQADAAFQELDEEVGEKTGDEEEMEALIDQTYDKVVHPRLLSYEIEADRIGSVLVANTGYDPFGLVRVSERVARVATETPDLFDRDYMLPNDAVERAKEIRAFSTKNFTSDTPGEQMRGRFTSVTSSVR